MGCSLYGSVARLDDRVDVANGGVAMAMAMAGGFLPDNKRFAMAVNYGTYGGQSAVAVSGFVRLDQNWVVSASAGYGANVDTFGGRVGLLTAW